MRWGYRADYRWSWSSSRVVTARVEPLMTPMFVLQTPGVYSVMPPPPPPACLVPSSLPVRYAAPPRLQVPVPGTAEYCGGPRGRSLYGVAVPMTRLRPTVGDGAMPGVVGGGPASRVDWTLHTANFYPLSRSPSTSNG